MTKSQHKVTNEAALSLWDIGAALDDIHVQFHQVQHLLKIYDEHIEDDLKLIHNHAADGGARYFVDRYDILRSLLEIIQLHTIRAAKELRSQIDAIYEASRYNSQSHV